ncbi:MAG TPA: glycosyltransferase family 4 protein [Rhodanobacteraceae bacterium]|nr:glycosyltransferase family 4 protein [Rhodanobacteraceae bacterium]
MKRVAVVVQRCHPSVVGGSEALAWQYARLLASRFEVEILTSTASDYMTWNNDLPAGVEPREGIPVHRFPVEITRGKYWFELHARLMREVHPARGEPLASRAYWREALEDEFIRFQGPYCPALEKHLEVHRDRYDAVVFCTYLYPTTYFGIRAVAPAKAILVPTLHDEPPAYLPVFAQRYGGYPNRIWLTDSEQRVAKRLWNADEGEVIGMAVEHTESTGPERRAKPYLLYSGRIEEGKGCRELLDAFMKFRKKSRIDATLVLTGVDNMRLPQRADIEFLGFVDERRKLALMAGAAAFVLPSEYESFSIVTLEAMAQKTPVLVNGRCEVLKDHIERSGAGFHFRTADELAALMERVLTIGADERARIGEAGRRYVLDRYSEPTIRERLVAAVGRVIERRGPGQGPMRKD